MKPQKYQAAPKTETGLMPAQGASGSEGAEIAPEEWDFRKIREDQLDAAVLYEYARSCDWVRAVFKRWHKKTYRPHTRSAALGKWARRSVGEILHQQGEEELPLEVMDWLIESMPPEFDTRNLIELWRIGATFPEPFLKLVKGHSEHLGQRRYKDCPAFWEVKPGAPKFPGAWLIHSPPIPSYILGDEVGEDLSFLRQFSGVIDLRFTKTKIEEDFGKWLDGLDDSKVEKLKLGKGKAASVPWFRLKELAAFRLEKLPTIK